MQSLASYYAQQEASLSPACIFKPKNADQVSAAVKVLSSLDLSDQIECKFAVRGGGQNPAVGSANINEGVTIDLSSMRQVEVSLDRTVAFVGPGSRWGDVYLELDAMNLTVAGGRVFTVGVGGLIIGGRQNSLTSSVFSLKTHSSEKEEYLFFPHEKVLSVTMSKTLKSSFPMARSSTPTPKKTETYG